MIKLFVRIFLLIGTLSIPLLSYASTGEVNSLNFNNTLNIITTNDIQAKIDSMWKMNSFSYNINYDYQEQLDDKWKMRPLTFNNFTKQSTLAIILSEFFNDTSIITMYAKTFNAIVGASGIGSFNTQTDVLSDSSMKNLKSIKIVSIPKLTNTARTEVESTYSWKNILKVGTKLIGVDF